MMDLFARVGWDELPDPSSGGVAIAYMLHEQPKVRLSVFSAGLGGSGLYGFAWLLVGW